MARRDSLVTHIEQEYAYTLWKDRLAFAELADSAVAAGLLTIKREGLESIGYYDSEENLVFRLYFYREQYELAVSSALAKRKYTIKELDSLAKSYRLHVLTCELTDYCVRDLLEEQIEKEARRKELQRLEAQTAAKRFELQQLEDQVLALKRLL